MRHLLTIICLTVVVLIGGAGVASGYVVKPSDVFSCKEIVSQHDSGNKDPFRMWLLGYISGRGYETGVLEGVGTMVDPLYNTVIEFCKDNPTKDVIDAVNYSHNKVLQ